MLIISIFILVLSISIYLLARKFAEFTKETNRRLVQLEEITKYHRRPDIQAIMNATATEERIK